MPRYKNPPGLEDDTAENAYQDELDDLDSAMADDDPGAEHYEDDPGSWDVCHPLYSPN